MPKVKIDELEYNTEDLSEYSLKILKSLQFVQKKLVEIECELSIYQTAKHSYQSALAEEIQKSDISPIE